MASNESLSAQQADYDTETDKEAAQPWLNLLEESDKAFADYHHRADNIDKLYADLNRLASGTRDREFQLLWSNIKVVGPTIYSRKPVPVVVPKFKDRNPVKGVAAELLERTAIVGFDLADVNGIMMLVRDDLAVQARGVIRLRYDEDKRGGYGEKVCIEHVDRKDFRHEPSRNWHEVGWVAFRGWLTREEMRERFQKHSGDEYLNAEYEVNKEAKNLGAADSIEKCGVWEIWSKTRNRVIWVAEGCEWVLDQREPHLKLEGFFPCPKPAYGTVQRRSLVPVPDFLQYKDQLEEINELTNRIHALTDALKVKGFYPAGAGEIGDAIETALKAVDDRQVMVPISNFAAFGTGSAKDTIVWLPIEQVVLVIRECVETRRQIIDDVYQIIGLSDIMRGTVDPDEKLGQSQLKSQYGSVRTRDMRDELVRVARDALCIMAEIMAENFDKKTLLAMSQMDIPTEKQIKEQIAQLTQQADEQVKARIQEAASNPELMQKAQENPQEAKAIADKMQAEIVAQIQPQIEKLKKQPTQEQVFELLRDQKTRAFSLDIETDSTIQPDEDAEKQRRNEFLAVIAPVMRQLGEMIMMFPQSAKFAGELLKFTAAPYRAARTLDTAIDEFVDSMQEQLSQQKANPEAEAAQAEAQAEQQRAQAEMAMKREELQAKMQIEQAKLQADREGKVLDAQIKERESGMKLQQIEAEERRDQQRHQMEMQKLQAEMQFKERELGLKMQAAEVDNQMKMQTAQISAQSAQQQAEIKASAAEQQMQHNEQSFLQQSELNKQKANQPGAGK